MAWGKSGHGKAEQGIDPGLQEQPGQVHAAGGGGLGMGVGQPGVHRNQGNLNAKGQQKGAEQQDFGGGAQWPMLHQLIYRKGVNPGLVSMQDIQGDEGDEHQQTAGQGVKQELDGRVDPVLMPPDAHQEEHGNNLDFPKEIKEQQIGGQEEAGQGALQEKDEEKEGADLEVDGLPGDRARKRY